jgi:hypothetical protein
MFTRPITRRSMTVASLAYLLVIVATTRTAFGGSAGLMQAGVGSFDACSLLTGADVQAATKRPVRPPQERYRESGDVRSMIRRIRLKVLNLNVLISANGADAKKALAIAKSNAADVQQVAGLGEDAYWDKYLRTLRIVKGRYEVDLVMDSEAGGLDAARALAAKALSRLPA